MRNLTIKRIKSFVGCLMKMKLYIEDPVSGTVNINNTLCSKLGELKNGEEKTFQIGEQAAKVFVIADKLTKDYCNEYYQLPEGQEDVALSGQNRFNPANGNAFRFENNPSEGIAASRRRGSRIGLAVLIAAILIGMVAGVLFGRSLLNRAPKEKTFSSDGMTITLTDAFRKTDVEPYTVVYDSQKVAVFALKEPFTLAEGIDALTLEDYTDLIIQANDLKDVEKKTVDGQPSLEYDFTNPDTKQTFHYYIYPFKTGDAFWTVQFAALKGRGEIDPPQIAAWAKSVAFDS
jgi:hypothetical protein